MKRDRRLLLAGAVTALVVLAVPALALASVWKDHATGLKVQKLVQLGLTGGELFEVPGTGGMSCEIKATLTTEGGSTGKITKYQTVSCPKGFEKFEKCQLSTAEARGLPWTVDVNTSDLTITNFHTKRTFNNCETKELDKTISSLTVTLVSPTEIAELEWVGETTGYKTIGSLAVEGTNSGTYEIG